MRMPTAVKTRQPRINVGTPTAGPIVPYRPPVPQGPLPQVITPQPVGTASKPAALPVPKPNEPDIIDAEIVPNRPQGQPSPSPRRPVVDGNARPSSQSARPTYYPQYPNPGDEWRSAADFTAWQNGQSRESIDEERQAYDRTRDWYDGPGVVGGLGPIKVRRQIPLADQLLANRFRARHGLPSIDNIGSESAQPVNPAVQPSRGFQSNPFKTPMPAPSQEPGTPSNFPASPYNFDIDPDTGKPYTELQRRRGDELGRPAWHIDPTTGNPWGSDEPGDPLPNPFPGYPGGVIRYPVPETNVKPSQWAVRFTLSHSNPAARGRGTQTFYVNSETAPSTEIRDEGPQESAWGPSGGTSRLLGFYFGGAQAALFGSGDTDEDGKWETFGISYGAPYPTAFTGAPDGESSPSAEPLGSPLPLPQSQPQPRPSPSDRPSPVQDPRVNPTLPTSQPYAPTLSPTDNPYVPSPLPLPEVPFNPGVLPNLPGTLAPPHQIVPFPRKSPTGQPQPSLEPSTQPSPARPQNPPATITTDRPKYPPVNPSPDPGDCNPCPNPCPEEEEVSIRYKEFKGCNVTPSGLPDRFREVTIKVPKKSAVVTKVTLDTLAEIQAQECAPCCYWDVEFGDPATLFVGIPNPIGQEFAIPKGIARIDITYNAVEALRDNTVRSLKRIANDGNPVNTYVNVAAVYLITPDGMAVDSTHLWVVGTALKVPLEYRDMDMRLRLMPKTVNVNYSIVDSGARWVLREE